MHVTGRLMIASVGAAIAGSAQPSKRTSRAPCSTAPCITYLALRCLSSSVVLFVGDVLQPVDGLAVELLLHRDVGHRCRARGAVPVLFARRKPHDITGPNLLDRSTPALDAS